MPAEQRGRSGRQWRTIDRDDGFATVWAAGAIAAVLAVCVLLVWVGSAAVARHRATSAADLAALAAAGHAGAGLQPACAQAARVADRMGATLSSCELNGWDALIKVAVDPGGGIAAFGPATAKARAGPVDDAR